MSDDNRTSEPFGTPAAGKAAGQNLDYFAPAAVGPRAAASQFGGVPAPPAAPSQFGPPPVGPMAPPPTFGAPPVYGQQPYQPAQRSGLPVWAIVAICVPVVLVVLAIVASIAIPVFLTQRDKAVAAATTVSIPDQLNGMSTSANADLRAQVQGLFSSMPSCTCFDPPVTSIYTDAGNTHAVVVGAAKVNSRFSADARATFVRNFWQSVRSSSGAQVGEARDEDAGKLGGTMSCASLAGGATGQICVAVDAGSFFFIADTYQGGAVDPAVPGIAREALVHRT